MPSLLLKAQKRDVTGKKVEKLRQKDLIPAVLYGQGIENQNISLVKNDFSKVYNQVGTGSLIDLQIDEDNPVKILVQAIQLNPTTDDITHVDFYQIKEGKKITTSVELNFIGEAPAVKELAGNLVKNIDQLEIECLPKDLEKAENITVDLSVLKTFNDIIHVSDLDIPQEIKVTQSADEAVALVKQPKEEVVEEVPAETIEGEEIADGEAPAETKEGEETADGEKPDAKGSQRAEEKSPQ